MTRDLNPNFNVPRTRSLASIMSYFTLSSVQSSLLQYFFFHFAQLQHIVILIRIQMSILDPLENEQLSYFLDQISSHLSLSFLFEGNVTNLAYSILLVITWIYLVFITIICLLCAIKAIKVNSNEIATHSKPLHPFLQFHFSIIFCLVNVILMAPFSSKNIAKSIETSINVGFQGLSALNLLLVIVNCLIGGVLAYFCINPFRDNNAFATRTSTFQVLTFVAKATLTIILPFVEQNAQGIQIFVFVLTLFLSLGKFILLFLTMPYYYSTGMKAALSWSSIVISLSIVTVFAVLFSGDAIKGNRLTIVLFDLILIPIILKLALIKLDRNVKSYLKPEANDVKSEEQALKKLVSIAVTRENLRMALYNEVDFNVYELWFLRDVAQHSSACEDSECFCVLINNKGLLPQGKSMKDIKVMLDIYIRRSISEFLRISINRLRDNYELRTALAHIVIVENSDKLTRALTHLFSISDNTASLWIRIKKEILLQEIQKKLNKHFLHKENGALDVKTFVDFHADRENFIDLLLSNTKKYLDFWSYYKESALKLIPLVQKSVIMEREADKIELLWNSHTKKYPAFYNQIKGVYCLYLTLVRNTPYTAARLVKKSYMNLLGQQETSGPQQKSSEISEQSLVLPDSIIFKVSISKERLGRIEHVSQNIRSILHYPQEEVVGKTLSALMTPVLASKHEEVLLHHLKRGQIEGSNIYHKNINGCIKSKSGFIQPCVAHAALAPYIQNSVNYIGVVRILDNKEDFILLTSEGLIEGFTENVGRTLRLDCSRPVYITDICKNLGDQLLESPVTQSPVTLNRHMSRFSGKSFNFEENTSKEFNRERTGFSSMGWSYKKVDISKLWASKNNEDKEMKMKKISFNKLGSQNDFNINNEMQLDIELRPEMLMGIQLYVMTFTNLNERAIGSTVYSHSQFRFRETLPQGSLDDIANEKDDFNEKEVVLPESCVSPKSPKSPFSFTKLDRLEVVSQRMALLSEENISPKSPKLLYPKMTPTDTSHFDFEYCDTDHYLNKRHIFSNLRVTINTLPSPGKEKLDNTGAPTQPIGFSKVLSEKSAHFEMREKRRIEDSSDIGTSNLAAVRLRSKLEEAAYSVPPSRLVELTVMSIKVFILLCVSLLIALIFYSEKMLTHVEADAKILTISSLRLFRLIETKRASEGMYMLKTGLYTDNRFAKYSLPPFRVILSASMTTAKDNLNPLNGELRISLNETEPELHRAFYDQLVPMVGNDSGLLYTRYENTFDAAIELVDRASEIIATYPNAITIPNYEDLDYIRRNVLNDLLITSENIGDTVVQDAHLKFQELINFTLALMVFFLVLGFVLVSLFSCQQVKMIQSRDKFIDIFLRIDENQITNTLDRVKKFETALGQFHLKPQDFRTQRDTIWGQERSKRESVQGSLLRRKNANLTGINTKQVILLLLTIVLFGLVMVPFIHMYALAIARNKVFTSKMNTMVEVNVGMYEMILMSVSFYDYVITKGNSMLLDKPIGEEWEAIYNRRATAQTYLLDLLIDDDTGGNGCSESTINTYRELVQGDLCSVLPAQNIQRLCPILANGLLQKGIQGMNGYYLLTLRTLKNDFDNSNKTWDTSKEILSRDELKDLELFLARWQYSAFEMMGDIFERCTIEMLQAYGGELKLFLVLYIVLCTVGAGVILMVWKRLVEEDRTAWRKILRKIPVVVVNSNKMLKTYLMKESRVGLKEN